MTSNIISSTMIVPVVKVVVSSVIDTGGITPPSVSLGKVAFKGGVYVESGTGKVSYRGGIYTETS